MKLSEVTKDIHIWIAEDIFALADMCRKKKNFLDEKSYHSYYRSRVGMIGNAFHSSKSNVILPYVTVEAASLKSGKRTSEHVNSRLRRAKQILDRVIANPNVKFERIVAYVVDSCKVVQTTNDENKGLEKRRKSHLKSGNKTIPWRLMYKLENCILLPRDLNEYRKFYYMIEGIRFDSASDVGEDYDITAAEVDKRALNKNSWHDWTKHSIETGERVYRKSYKPKNKPKKEFKVSQKYVYSIDGVVYNKTIVVLEKYGINYSTLLQRCNAKKKWPTWKRIEKGSE
jgi:hypothetical protein